MVERKQKGYAMIEIKFLELCRSLYILAHVAACKMLRLRLSFEFLIYKKTTKAVTKFKNTADELEIKAINLKVDSKNRYEQAFSKINKVITNVESSLNKIS
jgi:hypothetical protein